MTTGQTALRAAVFAVALFAALKITQPIAKRLTGESLSTSNVILTTALLVGAMLVARVFDDIKASLSMGIFWVAVRLLPSNYGGLSGRRK
jgi:hypothetical protein